LPQRYKELRLRHKVLRASLKLIFFISLLGSGKRDSHKLQSKRLLPYYATKIEGCEMRGFYCFLPPEHHELGVFV
jgi:hypothetical protein